MVNIKEWEEFIKLYKEFYPLDGPSISSKCNKPSSKSLNCGCWGCLFLKLKEQKLDEIKHSHSSIK